MNAERLELAKKLAARNYSVEISSDQLTNGVEVYIVEHPELAGCMAQAASLEQALKELQSATVDYIYYLLEDGLDVPGPLTAETSTKLDGSQRQFYYSWAFESKTLVQNIEDTTVADKDESTSPTKLGRFAAV